MIDSKSALAIGLIAVRLAHAAALPASPARVVAITLYVQIATDLAFR